MVYFSTIIHITKVDKEILILGREFANWINETKLSYSDAGSLVHNQPNRKLKEFSVSLSPSNKASASRKETEEALGIEYASRS